MTRFATWLAIGLVAVGLAFVLSTSAGLPEQVATHFGPGGQANGWMSRDGYRLLALALVLGLPLTMLGVTVWAPRLSGSFVKLPHREYWLAPERLEATRATLRAFGAAMAVLGALFAIGLHAAVLAANATSPPRLDEAPFLAGIGAFVAATVALVVAMNVRFRRLPKVR